MSKNESKTIKEALKEARDHIDKKDFKSGLKCCKRALNVDKSNYMALVFYGLCSAEVEQFDQAQQVIQFKILFLTFFSKNVFLYKRPTKKLLNLIQTN